MLTRVLLVEDDPDIRSGLSLLIGGTEGYRVVGACASCEEALEALGRETADVILLDIELPGISGLEGLPKLRAAAPQADVVMLTVHEDDQSIFAALCGGASGYLVKTTSPPRLLAALAELRERGAPMSPGIARRVAESFRRPAGSILTKREREILAQLCDGQSYKMIAAALYISQETVHSHLKSIYRKLEVNSKSEAVGKALRERLV